VIFVILAHFRENRIWRRDHQLAYRLTGAENRWSGPAAGGQQRFHSA